MTRKASRKVDILLIVPPPVFFDYVGPRTPDGVTPPLGLGYLAGALERAGYCVEILDMKLEGIRAAGLARLLQEKKPRVVGISTMVVTYRNGLRVAQVVKRTLPTTPVVVGGPQATFLVEETLACLDVDVLVRYEGEETLVELMQHYDGTGSALEEIRGIAFRDGERVHQTAPRPLIADLDSLPLPARHLFKMDRYARPGMLITARGCPSRCVFCAANALHPTEPYRTRSPHLVVDEIEEMMARYQLDFFFIADDTFTLRPKRAMEICDLIIERGLAIKWTCEARINTMTRVLAEKLAQAGCLGVQYGVETGNAEIMRRIHKGIKLDQVDQVVDWSQAAGLDVVCSFIIGLPWDTAETVEQTIHLGRRLERLGAPPTRQRDPGRGRVAAAFTVLTPLPGTYVYDRAQELGVRFLTRDWDRYNLIEPVIETAHLSAADIRKFYFEATG